ncbi:DNA translocase FtsK [Alysiella crassa]|uniref:DNA translocase FtsK n=1 Tax=Alysiella crassa TaxID=153491 RepID=A0A376BVH1_9NEIS|nr:DNA translocase FtsK [Alysiella crassa]SSY80808.1 DNA translocase FtsK [Alysiella crassa]
MWIFLLIIILVSVLAIMFWFYNQQETRFQDELDELRQQRHQPNPSPNKPEIAETPIFRQPENIISDKNQYDDLSDDKVNEDILTKAEQPLKTVIIFPENEYVDNYDHFRQPEMPEPAAPKIHAEPLVLPQKNIFQLAEELADTPPAFNSIRETDPFFAPPTTLPESELLPPEKLNHFAFELIDDDDPPAVITLEEATRNLRSLRELEEEQRIENTGELDENQAETEQTTETAHDDDSGATVSDKKIKNQPNQVVEPIDEIEAIRKRVAADIASAVEIPPEFAPSMLPEPNPELETITLEDAMRAWQDDEQELAATKPVVVDLEVDELQYDDVMNAVAVRERTLQHVPQPSPKPLPLDAETISEDEIRESLLRQRMARRQQLLAEAPVHSIIRQNIPTIPEDEVFANLARSNQYAPAARRRVRTKPLREDDLITPQNQHQRPVRHRMVDNEIVHEPEIITPRAPIPAPVRRARHRAAVVNTPPMPSPEAASLTRFTQVTPPPVAPMPPTISFSPLPEPVLIAPQIVEQAIHFPPPAIVRPDDFQAALNSPAYDYPMLEKPYYPAYKAQQDELAEIFEHADTPPAYPLPTTALLLPPQHDKSAVQTDEQLLENGITIEEKLAEFKVKVKVIDAYAGPVITRYEIEPDTGVRGNSVLNLEKDLARSLGMGSIRVVETIPGKNCMGVELPNPKRQMIRISEIFNSPQFTQSRSKLTLALGQDITGQPVVTDLAKAPHLLVAGTTGSGKSVGVNSMILSLLFKSTPEDVRLIMIDPKMLELSVYEGIPHLLTPVITDMKYAANALNWCVSEMEKRYRLMSHLGVRNLASYNAKIMEGQLQGQKYANPFSLSNEEPEPLEKLPFIVVVVDEFADLMMTAGKKIEELIARLAQKARAAGIHLILATQRPSVDVITGLIKANIPTRIAFQVSSKVDSRTILDQMGAENLLGQGDMLFLPPGTGYPQRVHGAFVVDSEVHEIVEYLKQFGEPDYVEDIIAGGNEISGSLNAGERGSNGGERDPLFDEAVATILRTQKPTISSLQRFLRIGYNKAATLFDQMEAEGIVSPADSAGKRTILARSDNVSEE